MTKYMVNYNGLHKRPTYTELVNYLEYEQEKIKLPNRFWTRLRNSPQLSQLDDVWMDESSNQQEKLIQNQRIKHEVLRQASASGVSAHVLQASQTPVYHLGTPIQSVAGEEFEDVVDDEVSVRESEIGRQKTRGLALISEHLRDVSNEQARGVVGEIVENVNREIEEKVKAKKMTASEYEGTEAGGTVGKTEPQETYITTGAASSSMSPRGMPTEKKGIVEYKNGIPVMPDNWVDNLNDADRRVYNSVKITNRNIPLSELRKMYKNLSGHTAHHDVGYWKLLDRLAYIIIYDY